MDAKLLKIILDDETLTDEQIAVLLVKAQKQAANQHFWADDDIPTEAELERFYNRYEFEIYDLAKAINSDDARGGLVSHTELGVGRNAPAYPSQPRSMNSTEGAPPGTKMTDADRFAAFAAEHNKRLRQRREK